MRDYEEELKKQKVKILVVTFEAGILVQSYTMETSLRWPLIIDQERELYRSYGMLSASFWDIWRPGTWWAYMKAIFRGHKLIKSEADISQRGGDVLIDPDGVVRMHYVGRGPADRPGIHEILNIIKKWSKH